MVTKEKNDLAIFHRKKMARFLDHSNLHQRVTQQLNPFQITESDIICFHQKVSQKSCGVTINVKYMWRQHYYLLLESSSVSLSLMQDFMALSTSKTTQYLEKVKIVPLQEKRSSFFELYHEKFPLTFFVKIAKIVITINSWLGFERGKVIGDWKKPF